MVVVKVERRDILNLVVLLGLVRVLPGELVRGCAQANADDAEDGLHLVFDQSLDGRVVFGTDFVDEGVDVTSKLSQLCLQDGVHSHRAFAREGFGKTGLGHHTCATIINLNQNHTFDYER